MYFFRIFLLSGILSISIFAKEYAIQKLSSSAKFQVKYQKTKEFEGLFSDISGLIRYDDSKNELNFIEGKIKVDSLQSNNNEINSLIKSDKILDSLDFPNILFITTKIEENKIFGNLIIKNVKKNIELEIQNDGVFLDSLYLSLYGKIKRSYFDLSWDELLDFGSSSVSNEIELKIDLEAKLIDNLNFKNKK